MSLPRYPKYKDSGVEWLGEVPEHWSVRALKRIVSTPITDGPHETPEFIDEGISFASAESVSSGRLDFAKIRGFISPADHEHFSQKYKPRRGDIFMVKSGATTGVTAIVDTDLDFNIWSPLAAIRCDVANCPRFVLNFLRSSCFLDAVTLGWNFGTQQNIGMGVIENLYLATPPLPEQETIASFLDRETEKIDALVVEQRRLIELLKEKRQAVISHAVTKGLNPDPPMKDSGVEWLGEIPTGWSVSGIKYSCEFVKDGTHLPPSRVDVGVPLLSVRNLIDGNFVLRDDDSMISEADYLELCRAFVPEPGDVLLAIVGATLGKTAVVPRGLGRFFIQRSLAVFRTNGSALNHRFLNLVFQSEQFQTLLWQFVGYSAQPGIYLGVLQNFRIPLPSLPEQLAIVAVLEVEAAKMDDLIAEATHAIDLLQERRTALISAAVTGKIDVRGLGVTEAA
jgi:type I restriction enzyme S subunit